MLCKNSHIVPARCTTAWTDHCKLMPAVSYPEELVYPTHSEHGKGRTTAYSVSHLCGSQVLHTFIQTSPNPHPEMHQSQQFGCAWFYSALRGIKLRSLTNHLVYSPASVPFHRAVACLKHQRASGISSGQPAYAFSPKTYATGTQLLGLPHRVAGPKAAQKSNSQPAVQLVMQIACIDACQQMTQQ